MAPAEGPVDPPDQEAALWRVNVDYIGSKEKLNRWLFSKMLAGTPPSSEVVFLDACAGSSAVSRYAASLGLTVIASDILAFSAEMVLGSAGFPASRLPEAADHIAVMNALPGIDGFFADNYTERANRLYFSLENARRIDALRAYLDTVAEPRLRSYLTYCSLEALSRVSNTAGVQAAYLKALKERARQPLAVRIEKTVSALGSIDAVTGDILETLRDPAFRASHHETVLYLDPPYNERQYGPNYHLYETFVRNDDPDIHGKTGVRNWTQESKSDFCSRKTCLDFTRAIIESTTARRIFISYNSDGLIPEAEMVDFLLSLPGGRFGVSTHALPQRRFKSDSSATRTYNDKPLKELLFEIERADETNIVSFPRRALSKAA